MPTSPDNGFFPILPQSNAAPTATSPLYAHVRAFLTGDPFGATPAADVIDFYAADVLPELFRAYRCLSEVDTSGNIVLKTTMSADDLRYFYRAAALDIVLRVMSGAGGSQYEAQVIKVTTDNVDRTISQSRTIADALVFLATEKARMLARISCIAAIRAQMPAVELFGVVGHRRSIEARCGVYGPAGIYGYGYDSSWFWNRWGF